MIGNDAIFKCLISSHVADFVSVTSWVDSEGGQLGSLKDKITGKHCIKVQFMTPPLLDFKLISNPSCYNINLKQLRLTILKISVVLPEYIHPSINFKDIINNKLK